MTKTRPSWRWLLLLALPAALGCSRHPAPSPGAASSSADAPAPNATSSAVVEGAEGIMPLVGLTVASGKPQVATLDDHHWKDAAGIKAELDGDFLLEVGLGDGKNGLNLTTLHGSGHASHVYRVGGGEPSWKRVTFDVDQGQLRDLVHVIEQNGFLHLPQAYQGPGGEGGAHWILHVRTGGLDKYVSTDGAFPEPVVAVARFVGEKIVGARPELRSRSKPTLLGKEWGQHLFRAARRYAEQVPEPGMLGFEDAGRIAGQVTFPGPVPDDLKIETRLTDQDDGDKVLVRSVQQKPRFWVFYDAERTDNRHRYQLDLQISGGGRALGHVSLPVLTHDGDHAVEVAASP